MGVDRSVAYCLELSCCSVLHPPGGCGLCHGSQLGADITGRGRLLQACVSGPGAGMRTSWLAAGRQPGPGSPACTPPCQDCSNRAILALELTYRQPMVRRGGCGRGLTAKKKSEFQIRARRRATRKQAHEVAANGFHIDCPDSIA